VPEPERPTRDVAALLAPGRVGVPPYRPYMHAEAGPRPTVRKLCSLVPVRDVCGSLAEPRGACALATPCRPSAAIGPTAAARRRPLSAILQPCRGSHHSLVALAHKEAPPPTALRPAIKAVASSPRASTEPPPARHWQPLVSSLLRLHPWLYVSYGPPWTDYSVGPWDYPACATRHLKAWSTRTTQE
jgi:hypothetical protein